MGTPSTRRGPHGHSCAADVLQMCQDNLSLPCSKTSPAWLPQQPQIPEPSTHVGTKRQSREQLAPSILRLLSRAQQGGAQTSRTWQNTGKNPVVLHGSRSTALQNAAEEHKRQKIKHPPRQHARSIPDRLHPALPQGDRAATVAHFPRFYPMRTAQGSRISRGFWKGNDKAAAAPVRI